jgi:hypothetical protein
MLLLYTMTEVFMHIHTLCVIDCLNRQDLQRALAAYMQALELDPTNTDVYIKVYTLYTLITADGTKLAFQLHASMSPMTALNGNNAH